MPINSVLHTNHQSIDRVLRTGLPVLLVFWSRNAPSGSDYDALLDNLAQRYAGRALIAKVDADAESELVKRYNIKQLPTLVGVKQGGVEVTLPGRVANSLAESWLTYLIEGGARPQTSSGEGEPTSTGRPSHANGTSTHAGAAESTTRPSAAAQSTGRPTSTGPVTIGDANFDQVISGELPVLVDFWAEWCGPCRMVAPSVDTLAHEFAGRAVVAKLNVDQNPQTARRYNIMSIPALLVFKHGKVVDQVVGAQPLPVLRQKLARAVGA